MDAAGAGEILPTEITEMLAAPAGLRFDDRGSISDDGTASTYPPTSTIHRSEPRVRAFGGRRPRLDPWNDASSGSRTSTA
jgi:hypothetical protein